MSLSSPYRYRTQADLGGAVEQAYENNCNGHNFLPFDKLAHFVHRQNVVSALREANIEPREGLVTFALERAQRLFLILAIIDQLPMLEAFQGLNPGQPTIDDEWLPINMNPRDCGRPLEKSSKTNLNGLFDKWDFPKRNLFDILQRQLTAPVFEDTFHFCFHQKRVLPYLQTEETAKAGTYSGFFGVVSKQEVHPAHLPLVVRDPNKKTIAVAVKEAVQSDRFYSEKEKKNLHQIVKGEFKSAHLIRPIASYEIIHGGQFLMFPWADGGHLGTYWKTYATGPLEPKNVHWVIRQFVGLFGALEELHEKGWRHGDLKPDNILFFKNEGEGGVLQIADLGLATAHTQSTEERREREMLTMTPSGMRRYEPPEEDQRRKLKVPRGRAYDVWSMGCTMLELLIWIVYGFGNLREFQNQETRYFWSLIPNAAHSPGSPPKYIIEPEVDSYMRALNDNPKVCSACRDMLELVRSKLLCIPVEKANGRSLEGNRATSEEAHAMMKIILDRCRDDSYESYLTAQGLDRSSKLTLPGAVYKDEGSLIPPPTKEALKDATSLPKFVTPEDLGGNFRLERRATDLSGSLQPQASHQSQMTVHDREQRNELTDNWERIENNEFALHVINLLDWKRVKPRKDKGQASLCGRCSAMRSTHLFESMLLFETLGHAGYRPLEVVLLRYTGATVGVASGPTLLSLYSEPGNTISPGSEVGQLGFPTLPRPAGTEQFTIMKEWIRACDETHDMCQRSTEQGVSNMPTRLVQVDDPIRLVNSSSMSPVPYAALSHCWGVVEENKKFCTYKSNLAQLQSFIDADGLPSMFRDTVSVTRGLGLKYVWIDSLCIVQDDPDEWEIEAAKMEEVFSSAYVTISASSASSSLEQFLTDRPDRPVVRVETTGGETIYACKNIDDFHSDVELSELNKRGWVLQERALSRRSIYFTSTQLYWECGAGIQCETLAQLRNTKAAFLGDASFPKLALDYYRDGRQVLIQDLYERYSSLAFTRVSDRAVAILGLQKRLERAFRTQAAFGLFSMYFARGLLWKRGQVRRMRPIVQPASRPVPSWSWLSKEGSIKHMELEFEKIDWATGTEFKTPFAPSQVQGVAKSPEDMVILRGLRRRLCITEAEMSAYVTFDMEQSLGAGNMWCVVIGRDKVNHDGGDMKVHVLVISPSGNTSDPDPGAYERVGVASVKIKHVDEVGEWVSIR